ARPPSATLFPYTTLFRSQAEQVTAIRERRVDVGASFIMTWPTPQFEAHRLVYTPLTGALLPASHPLAAKTSVRLRDLQDLTFLRSEEHTSELQSLAYLVC